MKDNKDKEELNIVHKNARKLLGLVNQLLDISRLESGNMKLQTTPQNVIPLLKGLVLSFASYAERKNITLKFTALQNEIIAYIDKEKIEKIVTNILSNALKFTPEGGQIEVAVRPSPATAGTPKSPPKEGTFQPKADKPLVYKNKLSPPLEGRGVGQNVITMNDFVEISICDTGIGIPKENLPRIFDRFYQVDGSHKREQEGSGIGLALTKELIELHKGTIRVESEDGKGTKFMVSIPLGKEHLKPDEIVEPIKGEHEITDSPTEEISIDESIVKHDPNLTAETEKPILLIAEDNSDVRNYIKNNLEKEFTILEAVDGEDGWNKSVNYIPDLIISDVMMPKMDGFELCKKLKTEERTSHIPIILLTAKASSQDKIEGFGTGADEYIMKPFEPEELKARIKNLIGQRKRIHDYFRKHGIVELDESIITDVDKKFLQKVFGTITENISNASFNVESLAERLSIHRSVLHKKIVSLTGEPPVGLIRRIRLKRAAELMEKKFGSISEVAFEVGFSNPAYFSECFKKQFGISPSLYPNKLINN